MTLGVLNRVLQAVVVDVRVDRGGADVGVPGELADDVDRDAGVGEVRAEGVAQHMLVPTSAQARLCRPERYAEVGEMSLLRATRAQKESAYS